MEIANALIHVARASKTNFLLNSIRLFRLPVSEKISLSAKCFLQSEDMGIPRPQRLRIIVLKDFVIFDTAIFGPHLSRRSKLLRLDQLYQVFDSHQKGLEEVDEWSFCLKVLDDVNGEQEVIEMTIHFSTADTLHEVREIMMEMTLRARNLRITQATRPLLDPSIQVGSE